MDVPIETRSKVAALYQYTCMSQNDIAQLVGISQPSVSRIIKYKRQSGNLCTHRKNVCGRKGLASQEAVKLLIQESIKNPRKTSAELKQFLAGNQTVLSCRTIRRILYNAGRKARRPVKKQLLTMAMKEKRLLWAESYKEWTSVEWRRVMFSDESQFFVQGQRSRYVRRSKGEDISELHIDSCVKNPQKRMYWGSFTH